MRSALAGLLLMLLAAGAGAEPPSPAGPGPAPGAAAVTRTLALFEQIDLQTVPAEQRRPLYLALTDTLLADGQQERALTALTLAAQAPPDPAATDAEQQFLARLHQIATPLLIAALQPGSPLAPWVRTELTRRSAPLPDTAGTERVVGVLLPLSGRYAPLGEDVQRGLELARSVHPLAAGIRFVYRDTAAREGAVAELLRELATTPELLAIIGPLLSSDAAAATAAAETEQLPLLLLAAREGITGGQAFRLALTAADQVRALAAYARDEGLQRYVILHPANRHGDLLAALFQETVAQGGGRIVARQSYPPGAIDLRPQLQELAAALRRDGGGAPEALFLPDQAQQAAQIIPQLPFARLDLLQLLGTSAWNTPEFGRMAGPLSEGAVLVDGFFADSPRPAVQDFVARFRAAHGTVPTPAVAQGFDAGRIVLTVLERPEIRTRSAVRAALAALPAIPSVTGLVRFRADGEAEKQLFLLQVQDGALVQIN